MSSSYNNKEHFSDNILINEQNDVLLSQPNEEDSEIDLKNELVSSEGQYKTFLQLLNDLNKELDLVSEKYNQNKFDRVNNEFKKLKTRLTLINENLQILEDTCQVKTEDPEIKALLEKTQKIFDEVQTKYQMVGDKIKNIMSPKTGIKENLSYIEHQEDEGVDPEVEHLFFKLGNEKQIDPGDKKVEMHKISNDIKYLTSEIQQKINEQGEDLSKFEELLDETKIKIKNSNQEDLIYSNSNNEEAELEHQNRTNTYLAAWCIGSVLLFFLMIVLKYLINTSDPNTQ